MSGEMLFEAMTDIDDELITRAADFKPHKIIPIKVISGVAAAVLVLAAGVYAFIPVSKGNDTTMNLSNYAGVTCDTASFEMAPEINEDGLQEMVEQSENKQALAEAVYEKEGICVHIVGWLEDYMICIENISEEEYLLYLIKSEEKVSLEESALTKEQKEAVLKMVEEYRSQK